MKVYRILPFFAPMAAITLFGRVFAKKDVSEGTLVHEGVHVAQQAKDGWRFYARYVLWRSWRVEYEAEACAAELRAGFGTIDAMAYSLSGGLYLWPCDYLTARKAIVRWLVNPGG